MCYLTGCSGDKPLYEALQLMYHDGLSSLAVVDNHFNVMGNISTTDVKVGLPLIHDGRVLTG